MYIDTMFVYTLICFALIDSVFSATYTCDPAASCGCTIPSVTTSARIVGGEEVSNRAWGWMLSLQYKGNHICGAVLIAADFAVTSAHCLSTTTVNLRNFTIVAGTNYLNDTSARVQRRSILAVYVYPNFAYNNFSNDLALFRFAPLTLGSGSTVSIICRANQNEEPFTVGQDLIAIGWGVETYGSAIISNVLRQVTVQAIDVNSADCQRVGIRDSITRFCAGVSGGGKDTCQGDSGGPLMAFYNNRWYLAGVPTSGRGCARAGYPGIYTRVAKFVTYIESVLANPDTPSFIFYSANFGDSAAAVSSNNNTSTIRLKTTTKNDGTRVFPSSFFFVVLLMRMVFAIYS